MVRAIVGANWGDEGKGKITDMLAKESDIIIRFQGGSNAGHTIINDYGKFALHLLPSGVFYQHTTSIIGNGVALNIPYLVQEIESLVERGVPKPRILVSDRAQILMPYHVLFDTYEEALADARKKFVGENPNILALPQTFKLGAVHLMMKDEAYEGKGQEDCGCACHMHGKLM